MCSVAGGIDQSFILLENILDKQGLKLPHKAFLVVCSFDSCADVKPAVVQSYSITVTAVGGLNHSSFVQSLLRAIDSSRALIAMLPSSLSVQMLPNKLTSRIEEVVKDGRGSRCKQPFGLNKRTLTVFKAKILDNPLLRVLVIEAFPAEPQRIYDSQVG